MITREKCEKNTLTLSLKISKEVWENALERAYETTKQKYSVQGFRKGKAPRKVIEKNYGDTIFYDEAFESVASKEYSEFLENNKDVEPVSYPRVTISKITLDGVEATISVDLIPEVKLGKYEGIKISVKPNTVSEEDVLKEVNKLVDANARFVESDQAASLGDFATIDFSGSVDGQKFEGGSAEDFRLELGSHSFIDNFEEQIVGMKKGDKKDIKVKFPEGYPAKELAGKNAIFAINVKKVEKKEVKELSDKFISDTTEFESVEEYKKDVRAKLELNAKEAANKEAQNKLIEKIVESSTVEIPTSMIEQETEQEIHNLSHQLAHQGLTLDQYLSFMKVTLDEFRQTKKQESEKSIKTRLVLMQIIKDNKIEVTDADFNAKVEEIATKMGEKADEVINNLSDAEHSYIENDILMTKLLELLKSKNSL